SLKGIKENVRWTLWAGIRLGVRRTAGELRVRCRDFLEWSGQVARRSVWWWQDVRSGPSQVRDFASARREATPRLRGHQGDRGPIRRDVFTESGNCLSDADDARGPGIRTRAARRGWEEDLRDHRRRPEVSGGEPTADRRHLLQDRRVRAEHFR